MALVAVVKMLVCRKGCARMFVALGSEPLDCACRSTGGVYNADGDTVTVWGDGALIGVANPCLLAAAQGKTAGVIWPYPEDNGKVTRLDSPVDAPLRHRTTPLGEVVRPEVALAQCVAGAVKYVMPGVTVGQVDSISERAAKWLRQSGFKVSVRDD